MFDQIESVRMNGPSLMVTIRHENDADPDALERIAKDPNCLLCSSCSPSFTAMSFDCGSRISLKRFLAQKRLEAKEAYGFLSGLFARLCDSMSTKAILLDTDWIFVSRYGDEISLAGIPLSLECWMLQRHELEHFIHQLIDEIHLNSGFEIIGKLQMFLKGDEITIDRLCTEFEDLWKAYRPKSLFANRKGPEPFRLKKPVYVMNAETKTDSTPVVQRTPSYQLPPQDLERTMVVQGLFSRPAILILDGQTYSITSEKTLVGSKDDCEICHPGLLDHQAWIEKKDDRYWIKKADPAASIILEGNVLKKRSRLKDGMHLKLDESEGIFYEQAI